MAQGISIHIGLNGVDPNQYNGWDGKLSGCVNDANSMEAIARSSGFTTNMLLNEQATYSAVIEAIGDAAQHLEAEDMLLLTYSGHGGQIDDESSDEDDGKDETWVLFDKELIDDQLYTLWGQFKAGVRIFVLSDSCHSGTVLRDLIMKQIMNASNLTREYSANTQGSLREKGIPHDVQAKHVARLKDEYKASQYLAGRKKDQDVSASVLLISGCQDNQTSSDGDTNGLFTEKLLGVWNNGAFQGTYQQFHKAIVTAMPPTQTPNYFYVGTDNPDFVAQQPFTIAPTNVSQPSQPSQPTDPTQPAQPASSGTPSVTGPASCDRDEETAPTFDIDKAGAPYYIFEVTSDTTLFGNQTNRTENNFYGSYDDSSVPNRLSDSTFTLPQAAWEALKQADTLYFRVGTTSSSTGWDDYKTSTKDDEGANAPSLSVISARALTHA